MATRALRRESRSVEREAHLRVVPDQQARKRKRRASPLPVVLLVVLTVFGVAALQAWVGQDGLRAAELEREVQREQERSTLLRAQVAQLSSPHRLKEEATKLGLVPAPDPVFLKAPIAPSDAVSMSRDETKSLAALAP